jgi:transposase-like protein/DNA-directed RNA polymerase subunit RPC12/RpoP
MKKQHTVSCIHCKSKKLYHISPTQYRCVTCKKTFSIKRRLQEESILKAFLENESAHLCSKKLNINYITAKKKYVKFRMCILNFLEKYYIQEQNSFSQYDEYYFLPYSKKGNVECFFESIGILGMSYENKVYTMLLLDQFAHLRHISKDLIDMHYFDHYLRNHTMAYFNSHNNPINQFWVFLEKFMLHFKGVNEKNFIYYLKEAEFKFNYTKEEQHTILYALLFDE